MGQLHVHDGGAAFAIHTHQPRAVRHERFPTLGTTRSRRHPKVLPRVAAHRVHARQLDQHTTARKVPRRRRHSVKAPWRGRPQAVAHKDGGVGYGGWGKDGESGKQPQCRRTAGMLTTTKDRGIPAACVARGTGTGTHPPPQRPKGKEEEEEEEEEEEGATTQYNTLV